MLLDFVNTKLAPGEDLTIALARCRREQAEAASMYRETGSFNAALWLQDWLKEECLILRAMDREGKQ